MKNPSSLLWIAMIFTCAYIGVIISRSDLIAKFEQKNWCLINKKTIQKHKYTFFLQLLSILKIDKQTDCADKAGDHSSPSIDKQMWPLLY